MLNNKRRPFFYVSQSIKKLSGARESEEKGEIER
jgi:hypothetical protein